MNKSSNKILIGILILLFDLLVSLYLFTNKEAFETSVKFFTSTEKENSSLKASNPTPKNAFLTNSGSLVYVVSGKVLEKQSDSLIVINNQQERIKIPFESSTKVYTVTSGNYDNAQHAQYNNIEVNNNIEVTFRKNPNENTYNVHSIVILNP